jgi:hypothetical protein
VITPVLAEHSKSFSLIDCISVGVDRVQRSFEPMHKQVERCQRSELTDVTAKVVIYEAFVEGKLEAAKHLARTVHDLYFEPKYEEFCPRTIWSLSNAFTSAFKGLVRRIHMAMCLLAPEETRDKVERVHAIYAMNCPLYRTLHNAIQLTSSFELVGS